MKKFTCRTALRAVAALTAVSLLAGCGSGAASSAAPAASAPAESTAAESTAAAAELDFPKKDITLVNPYEAGGTSDICFRMLAEYIGDSVMEGHTMEVTDVTGSGGAVGAEQVLNSANDGYTLLVAPAGYAMQYAKGTCEFTYEDFEPVCMAVTSYLALVVRTDSGIASYEDLIAKARESSLNFGVQTGGIPMFGVLAMQQQEDVTFNVCDIGSTAVKSTELLSGRVDVMIDSLAGVADYVESGDFTILGIYGDNRNPDYPDVPTFKELGYDTSCLNQVFGVWAPKGTDPAVVDYLSGLFQTACEAPEVQEQLTGSYYSATYIDTEDYVTYLGDMYQSFQDFASQLQLS